MALRLPTNSKEAVLLIEKKNYIDKSDILKQNSEWIMGMDLDSGNHVSFYSGIPFNFYIKKGTNKKLYVSLTGGAGGSSRESGPFYSRWTYFNEENTILCIDDPMVHIYKLHHGWFYGDAELDFTKLVSNLICDIADSLSINYSEIVFFSSSSGATASISAACHIRNHCSVIAINPQLNLKKDNFTKYVSEKVGFDILTDINRSDIIGKIIQTPDVNFLLIENVASQEDYENHYLDLCTRSNIEPTYGITTWNHIIIWTYCALDEFPHNAQDWKEFFPFIDHILQNKIKKNTAVIKEKDINELWNSFYKQKMKTTYQLSKIALLGDITDIIKKCENYSQNSFEFAELLCEYFCSPATENIDSAIKYAKMSVHNVQTKKKYIKLCLKRRKDEDYIEINKLIGDYGIKDDVDLLTEICTHLEEDCKKEEMEKILCMISKLDLSSERVVKTIDALRKSANPICHKCAFELCERYANMEGGYTQIRLGYMHSRGEGCTPNSNKAIACMRKAIELGHKWANVELVELLLKTDDNTCWKEAFEICTKNENQFDGIFESRMAEMYHDAKYVEYDLEKSIHILKRLVENGKKKYELQLANYLMESDNTDFHKRGFDIYVSHLDTNGEYVKPRISKCLLEGKGVEKDRARAAYYSRPKTTDISKKIKILGTISKKLDEFEYCIIIDYAENIPSLFFTCLQHNLYIKKTININDNFYWEQNRNTCIITSNDTKKILVNTYHISQGHIFIPEYSELNESGFLNIDPQVLSKKIHLNIEQSNRLAEIIQKNNKSAIIGNITNVPPDEDQVYFGRDLQLINCYNSGKKYTYIDARILFNKKNAYIYYNLKSIVEISFEYFKKINNTGKEIYI